MTRIKLDYRGSRPPREREKKKEKRKQRESERGEGRGGEGTSHRGESIVDACRRDRMRSRLEETGRGENKKNKKKKKLKKEGETMKQKRESPRA